MNTGSSMYPVNFMLSVTSIILYQRIHLEPTFCVLKRTPFIFEIMLYAYGKGAFCIEHFLVFPSYALLNHLYILFPF